MPINSCAIILLFFFHQNFDSILAEAEEKIYAISDRAWSLNINLQQSEESSSTVLSLDPMKSFFLWTVLEALALGFITTAALGSMHGHHHEHHPNFYHYPGIPHSNYYEDSEETSQPFPIIRDITEPSERNLYSSLPQKHKSSNSTPCSSKIMDKTKANQT